MWSYQPVKSIKIAEDKAKALIALVYKDSKVTKQVGSSDLPDFGGGIPQPTHPDPRVSLIAILWYLY